MGWGYGRLPGICTGSPVREFAAASAAGFAALPQGSFCTEGGAGYAPLKGRGKLHRGRCRLCAGRPARGVLRPRFSLSCQRKAAAPGGKENAFMPQNRRSLAGRLFAWLRELLVRSSDRVQNSSAGCAPLCSLNSCAPASRAAAVFEVVEGNLPFLPRCRYPSGNPWSRYAHTIIIAAERANSASCGCLFAPRTFSPTPGGWNPLRSRWRLCRLTDAAYPLRVKEGAAAPSFESF